MLVLLLKIKSKVFIVAYQACMIWAPVSSLSSSLPSSPPADGHAMPAPLACLRGHLQTLPELQWPPCLCQQYSVASGAGSGNHLHHETGAG